MRGQAAVRVHVDKAGAVANVEEEPGANPLLMAEATKCVKQWRFGPGSQEQFVTVVFHFGLSEDVRASDPKTVITADFKGPSIHVYITTDPAPTSHPNE
jgi:hypothetical protein